MRLKLSQPSLAGVGAGAELGKNLTQKSDFCTQSFWEALVCNASWNIYGWKRDTIVEYLIQLIKPTCSSDATIECDTGRMTDQPTNGFMTLFIAKCFNLNPFEYFSLLFPRLRRLCGGLRRLCGLGCAGYVVDFVRIILNSAQLSLSWGLGWAWQ